VQDWYFRKFGVMLDRKDDVLPLHKALQGHPEAGVLWENMITDILINQMGFKSTTQEPNLYRGKIDGDDLLVCRQVDDFAVAGRDDAHAKMFIEAIRTHVATEYQGMGTETPAGISHRYNGLDVHQTANYIKLDCTTYIDRLLQSHLWEHPASGTTDPHNLVPLSPEKTDGMMQVEGPVEGSTEADALATKVGFSYRQVLGELIYCRLDIGYAVCFLARFSSAPHVDHYVALKNVCHYLRRTRDWGLMYWRSKPRL
jgi:hypothetical protein